MNTEAYNNAKENSTPNDGVISIPTAQRIDLLQECLFTLQHAKDVIETWHSMGLPKDEGMWQLYQQSPEMKRINNMIERIILASNQLAFKQLGAGVHGDASWMDQARQRLAETNSTNSMNSINLSNPDLAPECDRCGHPSDQLNEDDLCPGCVRELTQR